MVALLRQYAVADPKAYQQLLEQQLALPDKHDRLRVLGLLQDLAAVAPALVLPLRPWLKVRSKNRIWPMSMDEKWLKRHENGPIWMPIVAPTVVRH